MRILLWILLLIFALPGCRRESGKKLENQSVIDEQLTQMNAKFVGTESKNIDDFVSRHSMHVERTGTGLRYEIYVHGKGVKPIMHDEVKINYSTFLLDGRKCYSSDSTGPVMFRISTGEQIRGLEEGVMLMVPGDKARLVIPSHLAFGIRGDQAAIPPASALYYEVELLEVKK